MDQYFFAGVVFEGVVGFLSRHSILLALVISALWFYAGHQDLTKDKSAGFLWEGIGVLLLVAFRIRAILAKEWLNLVVAAIAICAEIWLMQRVWAKSYR